MIPAYISWLNDLLSSSFASIAAYIIGAFFALVILYFLIIFCVAMFKYCFDLFRGKHDGVDGGGLPWL